VIVSGVSMGLSAMDPGSFSCSSYGLETCGDASD
jgi:hypothetical protein